MYSDKHDWQLLSQKKSHVRDHKIIQNLLSPGWLYIVWSVIRKRVYRSKSSNVDELKRRINGEWATLRHAVIEHAAREWRQRLCPCVRAERGHL